MERLRLTRGARAVWALNAALAARGSRVLPQHRRIAVPAPPRCARPLVGARGGLRAHRGRRRPRALPPRARTRSRSARSRSSLGLLFARPATSCSAGWSAPASCSRSSGRSAVRARLQRRPARRHRRARGRASSTRRRRRRRSSARSVWPAAAVAALLAAAVRCCSSAPRCGCRARRRAAQARRDARHGGLLARRPTPASASRAGTVIGTDLAGGVLLLAPAPAVFLAYRAYTSRAPPAHRPRVPLRREPRADARVGAAPGVAGMLAMALETFRGEVAEVCLLPADGEGNGRADHRRRPPSTSRSCSARGAASPTSSRR